MLWRWMNGTDVAPIGTLVSLFRAGTSTKYPRTLLWLDLQGPEMVVSSPCNGPADWRPNGGFRRAGSISSSSSGAYPAPNESAVPRQQRQARSAKARRKAIDQFMPVMAEGGDRLRLDGGRKSGLRPRTRPVAHLPGTIQGEAVAHRRQVARSAPSRGSGGSSARSISGQWRLMSAAQVSSRTARIGRRKSAGPRRDAAIDGGDFGSVRGAARQDGQVARPGTADRAGR